MLAQLGCDRREPEVRDANVALAIEHDVGGLEVAVDEPERVRGLKPESDLTQQASGRRKISCPARDEFAQRAADDELHRDEHAASAARQDVLADIVDLHDVGVRELREQLALAKRRGPGRGMRRIGCRPSLRITPRRRREQLECDSPLQLGVHGNVDDRGRTTAGHALDAVPTDLEGHRRRAEELRLKVPERASRVDRVLTACLGEQLADRVRLRHGCQFSAEARLRFNVAYWLHWSILSSRMRPSCFGVGERATRRPATRLRAVTSIRCTRSFAVACPRWPKTLRSAPSCPAWSGEPSWRRWLRSARTCSASHATSC